MKKIFSRICEAGLWLKYHVVLPLLSLLPSGAGYKVVTLYGRLVFAIDRQPRRSLASTIGNVMSGDAYSVEAERQVQYYYGLREREILDSFFYRRVSASNYESFVRFRGLEHLERARSTNEPIILYSGHYGRPVMPAVALGAQSISTGCITNHTEGLNSVEQNYRDKKLKDMAATMQGPFFYLGDSMRGLYSYLRDDCGILVILIDVACFEDPGKCFDVPFVHGRAQFYKGIIRIAQRTGATLIPYFGIEERQHLVGEFLPPVNIDALDEEQAFRKLLAPLEERVLAEPGQWWCWNSLPAFWTASD